MSEWSQGTLGDMIELKRGYDLPSQARRLGRVPIVSSSGPSGLHDESKVSAPGVVTGRYGTIGQVFYVDSDFWPLNTTLYVRDFKGNDPKFIAYFLRTLDFLTYSDKAAVPGVNRNHLHQAPVRWPDLSTQRAIASLLSLLDEKIEFNRRTNETLESMVAALYARATGAESLSDDLASIYDCCEVVYGAAFASALFNSERIGQPLLRIRDLSTESPAVFTSELHPKAHLIKAGDIVVGMDGEFRAHLWGGAEVWLNQRVCAFVPKPGYSSAFVRNAIRAPLALVEATETATTVIHLGKSDIDRFRIPRLAPKALEVFNQVADPMYARIVSNKRESQSLSILRDTLLPRLLSGELRIPDAEKLAEQAL